MRDTGCEHLLSVPFILVGTGFVLWSCFAQGAEAWERFALGLIVLGIAAIIARGR